VVPSGPTTHQRRHEPGSRTRPSDHRRATGRHVHRLAAYVRGHGRAHHMEPGARSPARRIGRAPGDPHGLPPPNRATWAGSPAASSPTGPRPSAPSRWPSGWAASTPPRPSWASPGRRYARPSPAMALACRHATPRPSASGRLRRPASARAGRPPPAWTRCLWPSTTASSPIWARSDGELAERLRRAEDYATLGARVVVELHSESRAAKPSTRAWVIARRADRGHRRQANRAGRTECL
jgi:hypothetical protein